MDSSQARARCKPGDKALIIKGRDLGRIVRVLGEYKVGQSVEGQNWVKTKLIPDHAVLLLVETLGSPLTVESAAPPFKRTLSDVDVYADYCLIPLLDEPERTSAEKATELH